MPSSFSHVFASALFQTTCLPLATVADFKPRSAEIDTSGPTSVGGSTKTRNKSCYTPFQIRRIFWPLDCLLVDTHWVCADYTVRHHFHRPRIRRHDYRGFRLVETGALGFACLGSRRFARMGQSASLRASFALGRHSNSQAWHTVRCRYSFRPATGLSRFGNRPCYLPLRPTNSFWPMAP